MPPLARACCDESRGSFDECEPAVVAVGMWKSRAFCGISKRGGNGGKVALAFGLFHGFHGASFPQRVSGSMLLRSFAVFSPTNSAEEPFFSMILSLSLSLAQGRYAQIGTYCVLPSGDKAYVLLSAG